MAVIVRGARLRTSQLAALILLVIAAGLIVAARPAPAALPASSVIGTVTITGLAGGANATTTAIPIKSYSWSLLNTPVDAGGNGKAAVSKFVVTKALDAASPLLYKAGVLGQHFSTATIRLFDPGTTTIRAVYTLGDVIVTTIADAQSSNSTSAQTETIGLHYRTLREAWTKTGGGVVQYCFNFVTSTAC